MCLMEEMRVWKFEKPSHTKLRYVVDVEVASDNLNM